MADSVRDDGGAGKRGSGARPRESLAGIRANRPAKAQLRPGADAQGRASRLREIAAESLRRVTSQKAAASDIGINEGRLSHKLKDGSLTLAQLAALGPEFALQLGRDLVEAYDLETKSPKERARERLPEIIREILEMTA